MRNASWWNSPSNRTSKIKGRGYGDGFNLILQ